MPEVGIAMEWVAIITEAGIVAVLALWLRNALNTIEFYRSKHFEDYDRMKAIRMVKEELKLDSQPD
ncbi:MAG: hypothetical protein AAFV98_06365 [Chloroflexota bacterium]